MKNIGDLHFQKEILPLLDFCYNEFSRDVLTQLLSEPPDTLAEVLIRQHIIRELMNNDRLYRPFFYSRFEFNEVYAYVQNLRIREEEVVGGSLAIHFLFARVKRHREQGKLSQLVLFFHQVQHAWFSGLGTDGFPWEFQNSVRNIRRMFADLDIERYQAIVRGNGLKIRDMARLIRMLEQKSRTGEMDVFWNDFFIFEAFLSISKGIVKYHFTFPSFTREGLSIQGFYHPLIKDPVLNSIDIRENVTLITGPNMSGKSTLLKSIGLCVYLAHLGLAVPAEKCEMGFFDVISVAINLNDDILSGYSHFMTEIISLKKVVVEARQASKCFAIFDELFRGTNVEDALAISQTTIQGLTQFHQSYFFISSHLHQLKETVTANPKIGTHFIECKLIDNAPVFTYRLRQGWSDLRIGQIIFEREGLNELLTFDHTV
jgi:DNA mismatch repair protein MutS